MPVLMAWQFDPEVAWYFIGVPVCKCTNAGKKLGFFSFKKFYFRKVRYVTYTEEWRLSEQGLETVGVLKHDKIADSL